MTTPTPLLREALATALRQTTNLLFAPPDDVERFVDGLLAHPYMQAVAEHEVVGRAVARLEATGHEYVIEARPMFILVKVADGRSRTGMWSEGRGKTIPEAIVAALGPSEGERT